MNILITGIHGFVGSSLVSVLKIQHFIYGLDIVSPDLEGVVKTFNWNEMEKMPAVDVIIHLAGKAHDTKNITSQDEYFDINVGLTRKIFQYFLESSATKFIFFSSVKAITDRVYGNQLTEEEIPNPQTPYGKSKLEAEKYILKQQLSNAKKVFILRPCMIHGPGNKGNLNLLYKLVQKGIPWPLGAYNNKRSFSTMDNLSFIIDQLIKKNIVPGIYQVADDETLSTNDLIHLIADSLHRKIRIWNVSPIIINLFAKTGDTFGLSLNSERIQKLTENYVVSNTKLKRALEIEKMPFTAKKGMEKTFASFL